MEKHIARSYLSKYTSGLKIKVEEKGNSGRSHKKSWWEENFEDPAVNWWKQSSNPWSTGDGKQPGGEEAAKLLGKVKTTEELYEQFFDKFDLASILCDYLKCIKLPTINLKLPSIHLPPFPKVPIWGFYNNFQTEFLIKTLKKLFLVMLKQLVSTLLDRLTTPFCEEQLKEFIAAGSSSGSPIIDQALTDSFTKLGDRVEKAKAEKAKQAFGNVANVVTGAELCHLMAGKSLDAAAMTMVASSAAN